MTVNAGGYANAVQVGKVGGGGDGDYAQTGDRGELGGVYACYRSSAVDSTWRTDIERQSGSHVGGISVSK